MEHLLTRDGQKIPQHKAHGRVAPSIGISMRPVLSFAAALILCTCRTSSTPVPTGTASPACLYEPSGPGPAGTVPIAVETLASGLQVPWSIAFLPRGDWLVTERTGTIRLFRSGKLVDQPVAKVDIAAGDEGGLLGIAADPAFESTRWIFLYATVRDGDGTVNRLLRYRMADDGLSASMDRVLIEAIPAARFHDGGRLRFGPDGMLYVGTGDARNPEASQDPRSLSGKILRVTKEGAPAPGNPVPGSPVFVSGLRNTEGFDWIDPSTLLVTDHGPSGELAGRTGHDEVSVARAGDNLGWPSIYGCEQQQGMISPLLSWKQAVPPGGAALYTGNPIPAWKGSLLIGVLGARHLHRVVLSADRTRVASHETYLLGDPPQGHGRLREVIMAPDGTVYVTTSNCDGRGTCPSDKDKVLRIKGAQP